MAEAFPREIFCLLSLVCPIPSGEATLSVDYATTSHHAITSVPGSVIPHNITETTTVDQLTTTVTPQSAQSSRTPTTSASTHVTSPPSRPIITTLSSVPITSVGEQLSASSSPPTQPAWVNKQLSIYSVSSLITSTHSTTPTKANSPDPIHLSLTDIMAIVGAGSVLLVVLCAALVVRSYHRRRLSRAADVDDTEALTTTISREEEPQEASQNSQGATASADDASRAEDAPSEIALVPRSQSQLGEVAERYIYPEQPEDCLAPPDQHLSLSPACASTSAPEDDHDGDSDLDSASFHTTRASSSRPGSLPIRPLPPIPRSRPCSAVTINPRLSLAPIQTALHREEEAEVQAAAAGPSRRGFDSTNTFQREVRRRESRNGLSTAHSQSSMFSCAPPSYNSARLPAYQLPDEEVPPLPGQDRGGGGDHDPDEHLPV